MLSLLQRDGVRTTLTDANCNTIIAALRVAAEVYDRNAALCYDIPTIKRELLSMAAEARKLVVKIEEGL